MDVVLIPRELEENAMELTTEKKLEILRRRIFEAVGEEFDINSSKQLGVILYEKLHLHLQSPGSSNESTDHDVSLDTLYELAVLYPVVSDILEYRRLEKIRCREEVL